MDSNGNPTGPELYKNIVKERYLIAKHANISYSDTAEVTPVERKHLLGFIMEDIDRQNQIIEEQNKKLAHTNNRRY